MNNAGETPHFGNMLKTLLSNRGMTQAELAGKIGISTSRLNNYIGGRNFPSIELITTIADNLQVTVDYLLGRNHSYLKDYKTSPATQLLNFYQKASVENGDVHKSVIPLYKTVSDPLKLFNEKTFEHGVTYSLCPSGYNEDQKGYALVVNDDSMAPFFMQEDIVYIENCELSYPAAEQVGFNEVFAVRLSEKDPIGLTLRKIIFRSNICVMVPINPEYPASTIYLEENGFKPIAGKPVAVFRNLRNYNTKLSDILSRH